MKAGGTLAAIKSIRYRSTLQDRSTFFLQAVSNMASHSTTPKSTWSPPHYVPSAQRHAGPVVGLAATLLPTLLLASLCLLWRFTQTWKSNARSLQWMFVGNFTMAARSTKSLLCPLGANLLPQLLAKVYLGLTLYATCRGEMGTSYDVLSSPTSQEEERTV
jgi:hypothetical protein